MSITPAKRLQYTLQLWLAQAARSGVLTSLVIAFVMALIWWLVAYLIMRPSDVAVVWSYQEGVVMLAGKSLDNPYFVRHFVYPPWTAVFMVPFAHLPLPLAVLMQIFLLYGLLALVMHKYGGTSWDVLLVLTSYLAFDVSIEPHSDWLSYLGLLVPAWLCGPFLLTKPQIALGACIGYSRRRMIYALLGVIVLLAISYLIWGLWAADMWKQVSEVTLRADYYGNFNLAPMYRLSTPVSLAIGLALAWRAFSRRDPVMGLFAWFFLNPYIPLYSMFIYFAMLTIRLPLIAKIFYATTWIIFLSIIVYYVVAVA